MSDSKQQPGNAGDPVQRRRVLRTVAILAVVAVSIYGYFIARGVFGA